MVQSLPQHAGSDEDWAHISAILCTLGQQELLDVEGKVLLSRLFPVDTLCLFDPQPVHFACTCNEGRVVDMLIGLGQKEVQSILDEQGSVEVVCDFCEKRFVFDVGEVQRMMLGQGVSWEQDVSSSN